MDSLKKLLMSLTKKGSNLKGYDISSLEGYVCAEKPKGELHPQPE